jgi:peptidoglycan/LPS O-acetylase OafA/YrhL
MRRVHFLDGLRGFAALFVVTYHTACAFEPAMTVGGTSPVHTPFDHFLRYAPIIGLPFKGNSAVCVFFVLSGVALSLGPLRKSDRSGAITAVVRRAPRLMIPALGAALISALLWATGAYRNVRPGRVPGNTWLTQFWKGDSTWDRPFHEATAGVVSRNVPHIDVPVLWTMPWEFLGSMLVFAILIVMPPRPVRFALYTVVLCLLRYRYSHEYYLFDFVVGMAACDIWLMLGNAKRRASRILAAIAGIYGLVLLSCPTPSTNGIGFYRRLFPPSLPFSHVDIAEREHLIGAALTVAALLALVPAQTALSTRPARFLGRVSFSLYLLHFLVLGSLGATLFIALHDAVPYTVDVAITAAVVVAVSLLAAYAFTVLIDEPAVRQLARINRPLNLLLGRGSQPEKPSDRSDQRALYEHREDDNDHDDAEEPVLQSLDTAVHGVEGRPEQDRDGSLQAAEDDEEPFVRS